MLFKRLHRVNLGGYLGKCLGAYLGYQIPKCYLRCYIKPTCGAS
jgi:hypothetical protein